MRRDLVQLASQALLGMPEVVSLLHAQPESRAIPAEPAQAHRHLGADGGPSGEDAVQSLARHPKLQRGLGHREPQGGQHVLTQDLSRMSRAASWAAPALSCLQAFSTFLVVLLQVDPNRLALLPLEGDAPRSVDMQAVALRPAPQGMEVEARDIEVRQGLRMIQGVQPSQRARLEIRPHSPAGTGLEEFLKSLVPEAPDHDARV